MAFSLFFFYMFKARKRSTPLGQELKATGSETSPVTPKNPWLTTWSAPARSCSTAHSSPVFL